MNQSEAIYYLNKTNKRENEMGIKWTPLRTLEVKVPGTTISASESDPVGLLTRLSILYDDEVENIQNAISALAGTNQVGIMTDLSRDAVYVVASGAGALTAAQMLDEEQVDFVNYAKVPKRQGQATARR